MSQAPESRNDQTPLLCLASASPRRRDLLASLGVPVTVSPGAIDETPLAGEAPGDYVTRLAREKAQAARAATRLPTLGSDTAVVLDGKILGKPCDERHAATMLAALSGREHDVLTAVAVDGPCGMQSTCVTTRVSLRTISAAEMAAYWQTGEPQDKAGGYAIQGYAAAFVTHIHGSYSAVVGLPLYETGMLLRRQGVALWHGRLL